MNKIINDFTRGFSLKNDDFRFIDAAVRLALNDICTALGSNSFILHGCVVSINGTTCSVTEGAIFFDTEIWHVAAHTFTVPDPLADAPYWCFTVSYDFTGAKLDKDLVSHDTYQLRKAVGYATNAAAGTVAAVQMDAMPAMMDVLLVRSYSQAVNVVYPNNPTEGTVNIIKMIGIVTLRGDLTQTIDGGGFTQLFTVPQGFRLNAKLAGIAYAEKLSDNSSIMVYWKLNADGKFYVKASPMITEGVKLFVNISYPV